LVQQNALYSDLPGLEEVMDRVIENVFGVRYRDGYSAEVNRAVERVLVDRIMMLAAQAPMAQVRAIASLSLRNLRLRIMEGSGTPEFAEEAHYAQLTRDINRFLERPMAPIAVPSAPTVPPGSPIGDPGMEWADWWRAGDSPSVWDPLNWWWN